MLRPFLDGFFILFAYIFFFSDENTKNCWKKWLIKAGWQPKVGPLPKGYLIFNPKNEKFPFIFRTGWEFVTLAWIIHIHSPIFASSFYKVLSVYLEVTVQVCGKFIAKYY